MKTKTTWAMEMAGNINEVVDKFEATLDSGKMDLDKVNVMRAEINGYLLQAIFGAEITEKKNELGMMFTKKPATQQELAELTKIMASFVTELESQIVVDDGTEDGAEIDIPNMDVSSAVDMLKPEKVNKKNLVNYLLQDEQAIGRMKIGPVDVAILAGISDEYRHHRNIKWITIAAISAAAIAAGVGATLIIRHAIKKNQLNAEDASLDAVDIDEDDIVDISNDDVVATDDEAPHVELDS